LRWIALSNVENNSFEDSHGMKDSTVISYLFIVTVTSSEESDGNRHPNI
jgi:hypothetical protein